MIFTELFRTYHTGLVHELYHKRGNGTDPLFKVTVVSRMFHEMCFVSRRLVIVVFILRYINVVLDEKGVFLFFVFA